LSERRRLDFKPAGGRTACNSKSQLDSCIAKLATQEALREIKNHLRDDIEKADEPQLKAMFETSAEVPGGLIKAFGDYEKKNESAWRKVSRIARRRMRQGMDPARPEPFLRQNILLWE
jgi:Zn-dependent M32 family carboxypeptidase